MMNQDRASAPNLEEILNAVTHGIGTILAIVALCVMVGLYNDVSEWHLMSGAIYGGSLVLLYLASTLYHSFTNEKLKSLFKFFDHAAIYILIAGNYTPFALIPLHGSFGWTIFGVIWSLAAIGILFKVFFVKKFRFFSTICYLLMGWFAVFIMKPLIAALSIEAIYWLIAGGVFYTVGAVFYLIKRIPYNHAIWHLFVLAGSAAHFIAVVNYVLPLHVM
ncbi:MAG: hemolysin-III related [Massilibacillus sp.]|jgi:hemolysin III|nr:hemolysin-III related [Massilibacillus sp.]